MHSAVAEKIANATGAYPLWVQNGVGIPFPQPNPIQNTEKYEEVKNIHTEIGEIDVLLN